MTAVLGRLLGIGRHRIVLWLVFIGVHFVLSVNNLTSLLNPFGDVRFIYSRWAIDAFQTGVWVGVDTPWVYPIVALVPIAVPWLIAPAYYPEVWLVMVFVLDAVVLGCVTGWGRRARNLAAGWWWTVFLLLLGPIALGRLDTVSVALAILGLLLLAKHPVASGVLLVAATWIKIWPVAIIGAVIIATRHRLAVLASVVGTSVAVVAVALAFGAGWNIVSFITMQTDRSLQVESPVATIWLWRALSGSAETYYDTDILTYQVRGEGVATAAALMNPLLIVAVGLVGGLGIRALRRGMNTAQLLPTLALALVTALIVFNKVGSPQYIAWLAAPVVLAFVTPGVVHRDFRVPGVGIILIAALTQLIYPTFYVELLALDPTMVIVITVRNLLLVALFGWTIAELWRARGTGRTAAEWDRTARPVGGLVGQGRDATPT
jgi:hypothetical protein